MVRNPLVRSSRVRAAILRAFGAQIGRATVLRHFAVHLPWRLRLGDRCWIGEDAWLHNQTEIVVGADCVISQQAFLTTGSHDARGSMDLTLSPIVIERGSWITSRAIVLQGTHVREGVILTPGSVLKGDTTPHTIYRGNPAVPVRERTYGCEY